MSKLALAEIIRIAADALASEDDGEMESPEEDAGEPGEESEDGMQAEAPETEAGQVAQRAVQIKALRDGRPHRGTPMQGMHRGMMGNAK